MLVTKLKAINQWMQCESCKLQQVKTITPRGSNVRPLPWDIPQGNSDLFELKRGGLRRGDEPTPPAEVTTIPLNCGASPDRRCIGVELCRAASAGSACHVEIGPSFQNFQLLSPSMRETEHECSRQSPAMAIPVPYSSSNRPRILLCEVKCLQTRRRCLARQSPHRISPMHPEKLLFVLQVGGRGRS